MYMHINYRQVFGLLVGLLFGFDGSLRQYFSLQQEGGMVRWCDGAGQTYSAGASYYLD